ncbi:MAG: hypothetical protein HY596_03940, partial [Candidatus Omnitrophica bacterium]|nr:hypothetical protein [Candidatus Omnitrophota bacterium]
MVYGLWTPPAHAATEFISTVKSTGGDYTSLVTWDANNASDLTAATTKVFAHGGITGTIADGAAVKGGTSLATGAAVHVTATQLLIKSITGTFQNAEKVCLSAETLPCTNFVTLSNAGDSAIAVAETSLKESLASTLTLGAWTTSATNYVEIRAAPAAKHTGVVGGTGAGIAFTGATGSLLSSGVPHLRLTNLYLESTGTSTASLIALTTGTLEARLAGCLIRKSSASATGDVLTVNAGAVKLANNFIVTANTANSYINLTSTAGGTNYLYANSCYSSGGGASSVLALSNASASSPTNLRGNIIFGFANAGPLSNTGGSALTQDYNAYDGTYASTGVNDKKNLTASAHLISLTAGSENLHLTNSSTLRGVGWPGLATDPNLPVTTDIDGENRSSNDIGGDSWAVASMSFTTQPAAIATPGALFNPQPVIALRDALGNTVTTDSTTSVTLSAVLASNNTLPGTGTLSGATTRSAVNGVVSFTDLSYSVEEIIQLKATATGLPIIYSNAVEVSSTKSLLLTSPSAAGISYAAGSAQTITWTDYKAVSQVKLSYSTDGGNTFPFLIADAAPETGSFAWTIPTLTSSTVKVKVENAASSLDFDVSDNNFAITAPTLTLTAPNGLEQWYPSEDRAITWTSSGTIQNDLKLDYTTNGTTYT